MNLEKYQTLTGITVDAASRDLFTAQIRRTRSVLENILGFALDSQRASKNFYNEIGQAKVDCADFTDIEGNYLPADDVNGAYRVFKYNEDNVKLLVDPYTEVYNIKLVYVSLDDIYSGYTVKTFTKDEIYPSARNGWGKWLDKPCQECSCECNCPGARMLAVDALWLNEDCLPDDLSYVWTDIITNETGCNKDIKSESIMTHSVTYVDKKDAGDLGLNLTDYQYKILQKYAGPNSSILDLRYT